MPKIDDIEKELESLSRSEKTQLLQRIVRGLGDAFPGVESTPGVCGGEHCILRTVWTPLATEASSGYAAGRRCNLPRFRAVPIA